MKFKLFVFLLLLATPILTVAQTNQRGAVKEYREANNKRPLSGVQLEITNAGSAVSDRKGDFLLEFRTLKPGQKVSVRRIEKVGYEIFNKEALEQWNINPDEPFTIIMVRSELFKQIRDNYSRISSKSYAEQYEKEKSALEKERQDGRITEEKLREQLEELSSWYDSQLNNLDNYVDRFARIDLSELSENERSIINLVKEGKLDEAIERYNKSNLIETFESETSESLKLSESIDALNALKIAKDNSISEIWDMLERQMDLYALKGGKDSYEKICEILKRVANADPKNIPIMAKCIAYASKINYVSLQCSLCELCDIENITDINYRIKLSCSYCNALLITGDFEKAIPYAEYIVSSSENDIGLRSVGLSMLLSIYELSMQIEKANEVLIDLIDCCNDESFNYSIDDNAKADIYESIASYYAKMGDYKNANKHFIVSFDLHETIYMANPNIKNMRHYVCIIVALGVNYYKNGDVENSILMLKKAQTLIENANMTHDPSFILEYYWVLKHLGIGYFSLGDFAVTELWFSAALKIIESVPGDVFVIEEKNDMYNNLGYLYYTTGQYDKSEKMYNAALDVCYEPYLNNPNKYIFNVTTVQINMSSLYLATQDYEKSIRFGKDALSNCELIYSAYPDYIVDNYVLTIQNIAKSALALGQKEYACELVEKALKLKPDDSVTKEIQASL